MYSISFQEDSLLPRERLAQEGVEALSNQELLAILLRTGTRQASVFEIAQKVLNNLSSLTDLKKMTLQELQSLSGIGRVKAIELQAMIELGHRNSQDTKPLRWKVFSAVKSWPRRCNRNWAIKNKSTWWRSISILKIKSSISRRFLSALPLVVSLSRERFFTMPSSIWQPLSSWFITILQER